MYAAFVIASALWLFFASSDGTSGDLLIDWLSRGGAIAVLATAVVAFVRGWVFSGTVVKELHSEIDQLRAERDKALELVYKQAEISSRALEVGERWSHMP